MDDADVKVTATAQIAQMYIRKQEIFTERKVYPYVKKEDLRLDLLPKLRVMAENKNNGQGHPWNSMTDDELLRSARLYSMDRVTGEQGFNLKYYIKKMREKHIIERVGSSRKGKWVVK